MKKLLFTVTTILLMCACNNNNSTGIGSTFSEMDSSHVLQGEPYTLFIYYGWRPNPAQSFLGFS